ncbi:hypothetical protein JRQ81_011812 [Phrynocephalus forsythii]|uniref:Uncharacterized protein n=1 Tax=Phrynocephalus forsythii TaxID=171643 RepID=A0A9Q1AQU5_9SAUR|nr:hypothetical protein JRQ81_011812 [Phrynocephalus forsythii]
MISTCWTGRSCHGSRQHLPRLTREYTRRLKDTSGLLHLPAQAGPTLLSQRPHPLPTLAVLWWGHWVTWSSALSELTLRRGGLAPKVRLCGTSPEDGSCEEERTLPLPFCFSIADFAMDTC